MSSLQKVGSGTASHHRFVSPCVLQVITNLLKAQGLENRHDSPREEIRPDPPMLSHASFARVYVPKCFAPRLDFTWLIVLQIFSSPSAVLPAALGAAPNLFAATVKTSGWSDQEIGNWHVCYCWSPKSESTFLIKSVRMLALMQAWIKKDIQKKLHSCGRVRMEEDIAHAWLHCETSTCNETSCGFTCYGGSSPLSRFRPSVWKQNVFFRFT